MLGKLVKSLAVFLCVYLYILVAESYFVNNQTCFSRIYHSQDDGEQDYCTSVTGVTFQVGSELIIKERCLKCNCSMLTAPNSAHMMCCGYGGKGHYTVPTGCSITIGTDNCTVNLVSAHNASKLCPY
ncbi:uncharacterized protein LOC123540621 [Mercenaria mercenaria]|uniref:uncharacterized protein LOC123540621 n=1 Tax=Mercenaria mercenaria TaxID=6596 RepID=UPI00234F15DE|nr:uncharacterized protein LOC123540621 [Mercenaria mercenaria]